MKYCIVGIAGILAGYIIGDFSSKRKNQKNIAHMKKNIEILDQWLIWKMSGVALADELKRRGITNIAVYGMGMLGRHLIRELNGSSVKVLYGIDRCKKKTYLGIPIMQLSDEIPDTDMIVNTVLRGAEGIEKDIGKYYKGTIVLLEDLIFDIEITETEEK